MCLQDTRSRRIWKRSSFQEADMVVIIPASSLRAAFLTCSLSLSLSACCIISPTLPSCLSCTSDAAVISPCSLRLAHSIHYSIRQEFRVSTLCCGVQSCRVMHGQNPLQINTPVFWSKMLLVCILRLKKKNVTPVQTWVQYFATELPARCHILLYKRIYAAEGHKTCLPSYRQPN